MKKNVSVKIEKRICIAEDVAKDIGMQLMRKRQERGFTIDDVHAETRIPQRYIHALETGNFALLPAEVYLVGSLKKYALFLGLEAVKLVNLYYDKSKLPVENCEQSKNIETSFDYVMLAVVSIVVLGVVLAFILVLPKSDIAPVTQPPAAVVEPAKIENVYVPSAQVSKIIPDTLTHKVLTLEIATSDTSWIKITSDDKPVFEGVLPAVTKRTWTSSTSFNVKIGYVPAVTVRLNGKDIDIRKNALQDVNTINLTWDDLK